MCPHIGGDVISELVKQQKKDWVNIAFLSLTPVIGIAGTAAWTWTHGFHLWMPILMMVMYALERHGPRFVLGFALGCVLSSVYGFLSGAWPFGVVELIWSGVAVRRYQQVALA